jgi:hypothetical protein
MPPDDPSVNPQAPAQPAPAAAPVAGTDSTTPAPSGTQRTRARDAKKESGSDDSDKSNKWKTVEWASIGVTAIVGFFFGAIGTQTADFVKRADDCYDALSQYSESVSSDFFYLNHASQPLRSYPDNSDPKQREDLQKQFHEFGAKYNSEIDFVYLKIQSRCPVTNPDHTEYLDKNNVAAFNHFHDELGKGCFEADQCSDERAGEVQTDAVQSTVPLIREARKVSQWTLWQRLQYGMTHII